MEIHIMKRGDYEWLDMYGLTEVDEAGNTCIKDIGRVVVVDLVSGDEEHAQDG